MNHSVTKKTITYKTCCATPGCASRIEHATATAPYGAGWRRRRHRGWICPSCVLLEEQQEAAARAARPRKPQGFAAMSPERRREVSAKGGKSAHAHRRAHEFAPGEEAIRAAQKGGKTAQAITAVLAKAKVARKDLRP